MDTNELKDIANKVRKIIIESVYQAQSGHSGPSLSVVEVLVALYFELMNFNSQEPDHPDRDRFVLSKGHAVPALYGVLIQKGVLDRSESSALRKMGSRLPGHPNMNLTPGIDMSSGSLGQGLSAAVGMALAGKIDQKDYSVYCLVGDGELEEGQIWEACLFAGNNKLDNLIVLVDNNGLQINGTLEDVNSPEPIANKFEAFGFETIYVEDGHDFDQIIKALKKANERNGKPTAVILKTVKGKGIPFMENQLAWHRKKITDQEYNQAMASLRDQDS